MATALVVGAGYLGLQTARLWRDRHITVYATTRRQERFSELSALGLVPILCNVLDPPMGTLPAADVVLYAVGFDRTAGVSMAEVYVAGLQKTLGIMSAPGRLIYISSTGVYGDAGGGWIDESTPVNPGDASGQVCLEAESALAEIAARRGITTIVLRLAGVYGPGRLIGAESLRAGEPIAADPEVYLNLIHVADAARIVDAAATHTAPSGLYLVADGRPVVRREFYCYLAALLNAPEPVFEPGSAHRQRGNRRISSEKMRQELGVELLYPDYRAGLDAIVAGTNVDADQRGSRH